MVSKKIMLDFIQEKTFKSPPPQKQPIKVVNIDLKDYDDEYGAIGEHFIVLCKCVSSDILQTCLVHKQTYYRYINQINAVKWI
jgi:hypothetical protein